MTCLSSLFNVKTSMANVFQTSESLRYPRLTSKPTVSKKSTTAYNSFGVILILEPFLREPPAISEHWLLVELLFQGKEMLYLRFCVELFKLLIRHNKCNNCARSQDAGEDGSPEFRAGESAWLL